MSQNYGQSQVNFGFSMVCVVFTFPILFLFYFMIDFKNYNISFSEDEARGVQEIESMFLSNEFTTNVHLVSKIREIGDTSKLILDPDLDSYYIMDTIIIRLPVIISYLNEFFMPGVLPEKQKALQIIIRENLNDMSYAIERARAEDRNFYRESQTLQSATFSKAYIEFLESVVRSMSTNDPGSAMTDGVNLWKVNNQIMREMLNQRIEHLKFERNRAIAITLSLWILSLSLVFYFAKVVLNKQKNLYDKIDNRNMMLSVSSKMSALGEMAGGVAHEINTPLAVIQMRADQLIESMEDKSLDNENLSEALRAIDQTVKRITKIVSGLRYFARDGSRDPMVSYSINQVVNDTFSLCSERFLNHGVGLNYIATEDVQIKCRPVELSQVLLNLINNSFDAIQELPDKWVRVVLSVSKDFVTISVVDSGKGIPIEVQKKMMQPFFTTKEIGRGTGLGLSISKGIIENHGGKIEVDSSIQTTTIHIHLPHSCRVQTAV